MCHSYIHYSYLQKYIAQVVFLFVFLICFRYSVLKSNEAKKKNLMFLSIKIDLFEKVKGRVRKRSTELEEKDSI